MSGLIGSFNPKFYAAITKQKFAKSLGFLIIFVMLISIIISFKYVTIIKERLPKINHWAQENLGSIFTDLPDIEIKDGLLILPAQYYCKEWGKNFAFIIEPQQEKAYSFIDQYPNAIVLTETKLVVKNTKSDSGQADIRMYELEEIKHLKLIPIEDGVKIFFEENTVDLTPALIESFINKFSWILYPAIFIWCVFMYSLSKPIQVLFFSLIALIFNRNLKQSLAYRQLLNIGVYALVPPTSLAIAVELLNIPIPGFWIIYLVVYNVYLFLGIKANKR